MERHLTTALTVIVAVTLTSCASPAQSYRTYRHDTAYAAEEIASAIETARLAASQSTHHRTTLAVTATSVTDAETDATSAQQTWEGQQPQDQYSLRLHQRVSTRIDAAVRHLRDLRIAVRNDDRQAVRVHSRALVDDHETMSRLQRVEP